MIACLRIIVVAGLAAVVALALANGLNATGTVIALVVVALGRLALGAASKVKAGTVSPGRCDACGGLVANSAPYCKHCGATL